MVKTYLDYLEGDKLADCMTDSDITKQAMDDYFKVIFAGESAQIAFKKHLINEDERAPREYDYFELMLGIKFIKDYINEHTSVIDRVAVTSLVTNPMTEAELNADYYD